MIYITKEEDVGLPYLQQLDTPTPTGTGPRWRYMRHARVVEAIINRCGQMGVTLKHPRYALNHNQRQLIAVWGTDVKGLSKGLEEREGFVRCLALVNSNDKTTSTRLYSGWHIIGDHRGPAFGFIPARIPAERRDLKHWVLEDQIRTMLHTWRAHQGQMKDSVRQFKRTRVIPTVADRYFMFVGRRRILPWRLVGVCDAAYRHGCWRVQSKWHLYTELSRAVATLGPWRALRALRYLFHFLKADQNRKAFDGV